MPQPSKSPPVKGKKNSAVDPQSSETVNKTEKEQGNHEDSVNTTTEAAVDVRSLPFDMQTAPDLLLKATEQVNEDIGRYRDIIVKYASNPRTCWHLWDRFMKKFYSSFTNNLSLMEYTCKMLYDQNQLDLEEVVFNDELDRLVKDLDGFQELLKEVKPPTSKDPTEFNQQTIKYVNDLHGLQGTVSELNRKYKQAEVELPKETLQKLNRLSDVCKKDKFVIVVIGLEKSGKSSLINYFIGKRLLPTSIKRCTYVTTILRSSNSDNTHVEITFFTPQELHENLERLRASPRGHEDIPTQEQEVELVQELLTLGNSKEFNGSEDQISENLRDYVANKQRMHLIKQCIVFSPNLKSKVPIEVQDLPGFDSPNDYMRNMTRQAIYDADAFIVVHDAYKPDQTREGLKLLRELNVQGSENIHSKGFVILTHVDMHTNKTDGEIAVQSSRKELQEIGFNNDNIFVGCPIFTVLNSAQNLSPEEKQTLQTLNSRMQQFPFIETGMGEAKMVVDKFMAETLPHSRAKEAEKVGNLIFKHSEQTQNRLKNLLPNREITKEALQVQKWAKLWQATKDICIKRANAWVYTNVSAKKELFPVEIVQSFNNSFSDVYSSKEAFSENLANEIPTSLAFLSLNDVWKIEMKKREDLLNYHLETTASKSELIATAIYQLLQGYEAELLGPFRKVVDFPFSLATVIPYSDCKNQVESLVMRVAYPAAHSVILWPRNHPQRANAIKELNFSVPEINLSEPHS